MLPTGQAPLPMLPAPGAKRCSSGTLLNGLWWHHWHGDGHLPPKPGCDGNQPPVTSWQHNSNHNSRCAEPSQSSLRKSPVLVPLLKPLTCFY